PKYPQTVLRETLARGAHRPQQPPLQIRRATVWIPQFTGERIPGEGIDGEVAPLEILIQGVREGHPRAAAEGLHVAPEGRHLVEVAVAGQDAHRAMLDPDRDGAPEDPLHVPRVGGG